MNTLREVLEAAERAHVAVGHFNFSDLVTLKAVATSAHELRVTVMVGVSEGERAFLDAPRRLGDERRRFPEGDQGGYHHHPHQHGVTCRVAPGNRDRPCRATDSRRPVQDPALEAVKDVVRARLRLFSRAHVET